MEELIRIEFLSMYKDKIKEEETYKEFLSSFTKDSLERLFKMNALITNDSKELAKAYLISNKNKKEIMEELEKQNKKIYSNLLKNADEMMIKQLEYYLKSYQKNLMVIQLNQLRISLHFISFLNENCLAKVNYSKSKKTVTLETPSELRKLLGNIIKDKKIIKNSKKIRIEKEQIHNLIATYGVILLSDLCKIYNKVYRKETRDSLLDKIIISQIYEDEIQIAPVEDDYMIYGISFEDEDDALSFYYSLDEKLDYKIYNKEEYKEIGEAEYFTGIEEYGKVYHYLEKLFSNKEEEINDFIEAMIIDYIFSYQIDEEEADSNYQKNIKRGYPNIKEKERKELLKRIKVLASYYPNYRNKGYSDQEIKK